MRALRRPAGHAAAVPRGHRRARSSSRRTRRKGVPDWTRTVIVHLPVRAAAPAARRRRARHRRVGGADEHRHLPPVAGAHRATSTTPTSCASTSTRSRAATSTTRSRRPSRCARCWPRSGLTAWAKTSGNRGVHVYARVAPTHEFLDVRHGVIGIARELERRLPDLVTTVVVEGGARRAGLRRLQPGLPRPHHRLGLQPAAAAGRAGVDAGDLGRARRRVSPGGLHRAHRARHRSPRPRRRVGRHRRRGRRRRGGARPVGQRTSTSAGWAS